MIYISVSTTNYTTYTSHHDLLTSGQVAVLRVTLNLDGTPIPVWNHFVFPGEERRKHSLNTI